MPLLANITCSVLDRGKMVRKFSTVKVNKIFTLIFPTNSCVKSCMFDAIASISPPQRLSLLYLDDELRPLLTLFLVLDSRLEDIFAKMNEAMIAQIRLAWWRDTINSDIKPKGEPLVEMIENVQNQYPKLDVTNALISLINGWEYLILSEENLSDDDIYHYASERGGAYFGLMAEACGKSELTEDFQNLGRIWALSSLFEKDNSNAEKARSLAYEYYKSFNIRQLARAIRPLSILTFPAIYALKTNYKKQDGILFGLSYIWHAISAR